MIKSFINYPGGKYRIINQLLENFPKHVSRMIDIFGGSGVVTANYNDADEYLLNDINKPLMSLIEYVKDSDPQKIEKDVVDVIEKFKLSNTSKNGYDYYRKFSEKGLSDINRESYLKLRDLYNSHEGYSDDLLLYVLIIFGFNNQIRFNSKGKFNNPVGKRDFNDMMRKKLYNFSHSINEKNVSLSCKNFLDIQLKNGDFIYADPPYSISNTVYNGKGFWDEDDDFKLMKYLDAANEKGIKFAMSNVLEHKGKHNYPLKEWAKKYNIVEINRSYKNSSYHTVKKDSREVLIKNY